MGSQTFRWVRRFVVIAALALAVLAPAAAFAQTDPGYIPPNPGTHDPCPPTGTVVPGVCNVSVKVSQASPASPGGALAFTGANIALLVGLGLVVTAGGVILVRLGRHASATN